MSDTLEQAQAAFDAAVEAYKLAEEDRDNLEDWAMRKYREHMDAVFTARAAWTIRGAMAANGSAAQHSAAEDTFRDACDADYRAMREYLQVSRMREVAEERLAPAEQAVETARIALEEAKAADAEEVAQLTEAERDADDAYTRARHAHDAAVNKLEEAKRAATAAQAMLDRCIHQAASEEEESK